MRIIKESEIKELLNSKNLPIKTHLFAKENNIAIKTIVNTHMYICLFPFDILHFICIESQKKL
ncbi:MAG TPA: hypothetical protein ENG63_09735 [Candidatus Desulfofervidus auxilii]|uniref:Uncharacterized protein n=1 Tax=Desulfofervidus auxilii TaxID=1621989 RepID=A0A7C0Y5T2_DESA2|nr:hypothetical protein [Candidatus Desulfofervidus auxilii]